MAITQTPLSVWQNAFEYDPSLIDSEAVKKFFNRRNLEFCVGDPILENFRYRMEKDDTQLLFAVKDNSNRLTGVLSATINSKGVYTGKAANGLTFLHTKTTNGFSGFVKFNSSSKVVCLSVKLESALIIASVFKSVSTRALLTSENLGRYYPEQGVKCVLVFPENEIETEIALNLKEKLESGSQISFPTVILPLPKGFKNWLSVYLGSAGSSAFPTIQILN